MKYLTGPGQVELGGPGLGVGGDVRFAPAGGVADDELAAVAARTTCRAGTAGWRRAAKDPIRAHPDRHFDREIGQHERQAGPS
jgi:hypothetical protein